MASSKRLLFCFLVLLLGARSVRAQEAEHEEPRQSDVSDSDDETNPTWRPWVFRFAHKPGWVDPTTNLTSGNTPSGVAIDRMQEVNFELGWQTEGSKSWHRLYRNPSLGLGLSYLRFKDGDALGSPTKIYGWFSWPFAPIGKRANLISELSFGGAFSWNRFDPLSNPSNDAVSTRATFYTGVALLLEAHLSPRITLAGGVDYSHYSNGGTGEPNGGVNTLGPVIRVRVGLGEPRIRSLPSPSPAVELDADAAGSRKVAWVPTLLGGVGWKYLRGEPGSTLEVPKNFGVAAFSFEMKHRVFPMSRVGGGLDLAFDGSADALVQRPEDITASAQTSLGVYVGYEHVIHRISIPIQFGYYVWRGREDDRIPASYQKLGWKFDLTERWLVGMDVRFFDLGKADFVTWSVGYRFRSASK